jgi:hypothetical protein
VTPEKCKNCVHRYNDVSEGQNCRAVTRNVMGVDWPGVAVEDAFAQCHGVKHEPRTFGPLAYLVGL